MVVLWKLICFCLVFSISRSGAASIADDTLQMVHVLYRHGMRTPIHYYPTDPHAHHFKLGPGQLTFYGMHQQYTLGQFLRRRYSGLLNSTYSADEIYIRSTDKDRTLQSALSNLQGLYLDRVNKTPPWLPIPVHTVSLHTDLFLHARMSNCPKYRDLSMNHLNDDDTKALAKNEASFLRFLCEKTNLTSITVDTAYKLADTLEIERYSNLTLPDWATPQRVQRLVNIERFWTKKMFEDVLQKRLTGGLMAGKIAENMQNLSTGGLTTRRVVVYSAHDTTVIPLLAVLDAWDGRMPLFTATVLVELHKNREGEHFVRVFLKKGTTAFSVDDSDPTELTLPYCPAPCSLNAFRKFVSTRVPANINEECKSLSVIDVIFHGLAQKFVYAIAGIIIVLFLVVSLTVVAVCCRRSANRKRNRARYNRSAMRNSEDPSEHVLLDYDV